MAWLPSQELHFPQCSAKVNRGGPGLGGLVYAEPPGSCSLVCSQARCCGPALAFVCPWACTAVVSEAAGRSGHPGEPGPRWQAAPGALCCPHDPEQGKPAPLQRRPAARGEVCGCRKRPAGPEVGLRAGTQGMHGGAEEGGRVSP